VGRQAKRSRPASGGLRWPRPRARAAFQRGGQREFSARAGRARGQVLGGGGEVQRGGGRAAAGSALPRPCCIGAVTVGRGVGRRGGHGRVFLSWRCGGVGGEIDDGRDGVVWSVRRRAVLGGGAGGRSGWDALLAAVRWRGGERGKRGVFRAGRAGVADGGPAPSGARRWRAHGDPVLVADARCRSLPSRWSR
jgi:hypothetical protein